MGLFDFARDQFIDVIQWEHDTRDLLVWKFPRHDNAIKMGAQLIVRESQVAVFLKAGVVADVFAPGKYTLSTDNIPVFTALSNWKHLFNDPFIAEVYFVSTRQFINQKWGTKNPIIIRDAQFGPVRLRAFGSFNFQVIDAKLFISQISGTNPEYSLENIHEQLRDNVITRSMDAIAQSKLPVMDLAANCNEIGDLISQGIQPEFEQIGLSLTKLLVENISLPQEVEEKLDERSEMGILENLSAYTQYKSASAIEKAAENSSGDSLGNSGMGIGVGFGMMNRIGQAFNQGANTNDATPFRTDTPPPLPTKLYHIAKDGKSDGPHSVSDIGNMIQTDAISKDTMVWTKGMTGWATAGTVGDFADFFDNEPPPLPL